MSFSEEQNHLNNPLERQLGETILSLICDCTASRHSRIWFENRGLIGAAMGNRIDQKTEEIAKRIKEVVKELQEDYMSADDAFG